MKEQNMIKRPEAGSDEPRLPATYSKPVLKLHRKWDITTGGGMPSGGGTFYDPFGPDPG